MKKFGIGEKSSNYETKQSSMFGIGKRQSSWDPLVDDDVSPLATCVMRVQHDLRNIHADPIPGILVVPDDGDITLCHALIVGPEGTPYEGGFFYFILRFPHNYPLSPPRVKNLTTDNYCVRFNPNLYSNGKVCLSILGTWAGPPWSPAQTLSSVLISIQSLMNEDPYFNEPGYHQERSCGASERYKSYLMHETIRVAVCDNLSERKSCGRKMPEKLRFAMLSFFSDFYDHYVSVCDREIASEGTRMHDPFNTLKSCSRFQYGHLKKRLESIKANLEEEIKKSPIASESEERSDNVACGSKIGGGRKLMEKKKTTEENGSTNKSIVDNSLVGIVETAVSLGFDMHDDDDESVYGILEAHDVKDEESTKMT